MGQLEKLVKVIRSEANAHVNQFNKHTLIKLPWDGNLTLHFFA